MYDYYGFVIDTNLYSGNFEREMCSFLTGYVPDNGYDNSVDENEDYSLFTDEYGLDLFYLVTDDHGVTTAVEVYPTANLYNNGHGFHYQEGEEATALEEFQNYTRKYYGDIINRNEKTRERLRNGEVVANWTEEAIDRENAIHRKTIENAENMKVEDVAKYPAYQSVIIYLDEKPTEEQIAFMMRKAKEFAEKQYRHSGDTPLEITGYRTVGFKSTGDVLETVEA